MPGSLGSMVAAATRIILNLFNVQVKRALVASIVQICFTFEYADGMPRHYDLDRMRLLRELAHRGTMTAVADALAFSRSAVSQQLAQLEREVGAPLLEKDGRRVRLTPEGLLVAESADRIVAELEELRARIRCTQGSVRGRLRVASMQTVTLGLLPDVLSAMRASYPDLEIVTVQAEPDVALSGLLVEDFDLVITESYPQWPVIYPPGVHTEKIQTERMHVASIADGAGGARRAALAEFSECRWAMEPEDTPAREWAMNMCRAAGFIPIIGLETADMVSQAHYVARGEVVAFLPELLWRVVDLKVGLTDVDPDACRELHLTTRIGSELDPAISAFRDLLLHPERVRHQFGQ